MSPKRLVVAGLLGIFLLAAVFVAASFQAVGAIDEASVASEKERATMALFAVLAAGDKADAATAERLETEFLLQGARFTADSTLAPDEVRVAVPGLAPIGLTWTPRRFGTETFAVIAPFRLLTTGLVVVLLSVILFSLYRLTRDLEARRAEATMLAGRDVLTGLGNRLAFENRLKALGDGPVQTPLALFYLDLDDFKPVNDTFGHAAGDLLLKMVGQRLTELATREDMVVRLGGDEFAVVRTHGLERAALTDFAVALHERLSTPYDLAGTAVKVGVSMGIATLPEHADDALALVMAADAALYRTKARNDAFYLFAAPKPALLPQAALPRDAA